MQFCGDVPPGNARAKECLEQHRNEANFSTACKDELETMIIARSADFRLDPQLRTHCVKDIEELCMPSYYEVADLPDDHAEVITCLQDFRYLASLSRTVFLVFHWLHASAQRICAAVAHCALTAPSLRPHYKSGGEGSALSIYLASV